MKPIITDTAGIVRLAMNATGRNRSVYEDKFVSEVDPEGLHVSALQFPHNDVEMRTQWLCKMKNCEEPVSIWLDVDFDILDQVSHDIEVPVESR